MKGEAGVFLSDDRMTGQESHEVNCSRRNGQSCEDEIFTMRITHVGVVSVVSSRMEI